MTNNPSLRADLAIIAGQIKPGSKILDVGCGEGALLAHLLEHKQVDGRGIEISQTGVSACVKSGLSVIQGDADKDLQFYPDNSFDYVVSSQVIQATHNPKKVLAEMLRIGKKAVISLPNFGYWRNRWYLMRHGRMPVTETLSYEWYETPNIHFCTLWDFIILCTELGFSIESSSYILANGKPVSTGLVAYHFPNLFAEQGVFTVIPQGR